MAEITAALVKELRERSSAGMMDCKKALAENNGDIEAAMDWLRKKGLSAAAKKAGRVAAEGLIAVTTSGTKGAIVEINAETDFVARNDQFQDFVEQSAKIALEKNGDVEAVKAADMGGKSVQDKLTDLVATIGENMQVRRAATLSVTDGVVTSYVHSALKPGLGKIGVLIALESTGDKAKLEALAKQLAMHAAAARPEALDVSGVSADALEREKAILREQGAAGKPADIVEKMMEGRIRKYYEQVVLLEQTFIIDGESKISAIIEKASKDLGTPVTLSGFVRYELGEGIEKQQDDFAAEVAKMAAGG